MLGDAKVSAVLAVKDLEESRKYYEETLGLKKQKENPGGIAYGNGSTSVFIYQTEFAGTNKATALTWEVDDVEAMIEALKAKGVTFEHYDNLPGTTRDGDVHLMGPAKAAWFIDPSGNILSIGSGM